MLAREAASAHYAVYEARTGQGDEVWVFRTATLLALGVAGYLRKATPIEHYRQRKLDILRDALERVLTTLVAALRFSIRCPD